MGPAEITCLIRSLGLSQADLAELGGVSDRQARRWINGASPVPYDVQEALFDLDKDVEELTSQMVSSCENGDDVIFVWRTTADLRAAMPQLPVRGQAFGFFVGPYQIAAWAALDVLGGPRKTEVEIQFPD